MRYSSLLACVLLYSAMPVVRAENPQSAPPQRVQAELVSTVKAKKARVGDVVTARTISAMVLPGSKVVPIGSKLIGHIRSVEADSADAHSSSVAVSFDEVEIKGGQMISLILSIRAAMMPGAAQAPTDSNDPTYKMQDASAVSSTKPLSGRAYTLADATAASLEHPALPTPQSGNSASNGGTVVAPGSVVGMAGVQLVLDDGPSHASKFTSAKKNLELQQGLLLALSTVQ